MALTVVDKEPFSDSQATRVYKKDAITIYRQWQFDGSRLRGYGGFVWELDKPTKARCHRCKPSAPGAPHRCGLYGYVEPDIIKLYALTPAPDYRIVFGSAKMWGRIYLATHVGKPTEAVRGQYGQINSLYILRRLEKSTIVQELIRLCRKNKIEIEWV